MSNLPPEFAAQEYIPGEFDFSEAIRRVRERGEDASEFEAAQRAQEEALAARKRANAERARANAARQEPPTPAA